jgi:F-type H+-transporting ATPase subunit b
MDAILDALGRLVLRALPTFALLIGLHFYLKRMFFAPLDRVLDQRRQATEGARSAAQTTLEKASAKAAEHAAALRAVRGEIYKEQEETRRQWRQEQSGAIEQSRREALEISRQAREQLAAEVAQARQLLSGQSESLANQIAEAILKGARN